MDIIVKGLLLVINNTKHGISIAVSKMLIRLNFLFSGHKYDIFPSLIVFCVSLLPRIALFIFYLTVNPKSFLGDMMDSMNYINAATNLINPTSI